MKRTLAILMVMVMSLSTINTTAFVVAADHSTLSGMETLKPETAVETEVVNEKIEIEEAEITEKVATEEATTEEATTDEAATTEEATTEEVETEEVGTEEVGTEEVGTEEVETEEIGTEEAETEEIREQSVSENTIHPIMMSSTYSETALADVTNIVGINDGNCWAFGETELAGSNKKVNATAIVGDNLQFRLRAPGGLGAARWTMSNASILGTNEKSNSKEDFHLWQTHAHYAVNGL